MQRQQRLRELINWIILEAGVRCFPIYDDIINPLISNVWKIIIKIRFPKITWMGLEELLQHSYTYIQYDYDFRSN
jgi:hypothetical protein